MAKLIFFAGSARKDSINKKLARSAADMAEALGAEVTYVDLRDYPMPLYDGDLEDAEGMPENAQKLKKMFVEHDGFFVASPEYNSSISPLLKNTIDWMSRPGGVEASPYKGKIAALGASSPGAIGGLRGLIPLRLLLSHLGVHVIADQIAVSSGHEAFDEDGNLKDARQADFLKSTVETLVKSADKLA